MRPTWTVNRLCHAATGLWLCVALAGQCASAWADAPAPAQAPGVDDKALHLATIVTADVPAAQRDAALSVISDCLAERSPHPSAAGAPRPWQHHVWQLGANPARWPQELAAHQHRQPVFAVVSGSSGGAWTPIHQFCEQQNMPCVLPNTAAVDDTVPSHWSFYFSRGTSLEAAVLAQRLASTAPLGGWRRIVQRTDGSEPAQLAALALTRHLRKLGVTAPIEQRKHDPISDLSLGRNLTEQEALVLWLNPNALRFLTRAVTPPEAGQVFISGELGGLDDAPVAMPWRKRAWMVYPYEPADQRNDRIARNTRHNMDHQGLAQPPGLSRLLANTAWACEVAAKALHAMRNNYSRAHFVHLLEAVDEAAATTAYPRFALGPGQRHGFSGAFIMQYATPTLLHLVSTGDAIVPH